MIKTHMKLLELIERTGEGKLYLDERDFQLFDTIGGRWNSLDGGLVASVAGVMSAPTAFMTRWSGTNAVTGIDLPWSTFQGMICIIPTGIFTWTTATNIALAGTAVVGKALYFTYLQSTAKWYPSYVA